MPQITGAPKEMNDMLESVYATCMKDSKDPAKCSQISLGAAKKAGWSKDKDGKWIKTKEMEADFCPDCLLDFETEFAFIPPESGDAPKAVKDIIAGAYDSCRGAWVKANPDDKENKGNKTKCSQIAWGAVENAGWAKDKDGKWQNKKDMAKEKPMLNFEELMKDCQNMDAVMFKEKYGIEKEKGKGILDSLWLDKLAQMESENGKEFEIYRDYVKGFAKTIKDVEIFEPGYHNGKTFTDADIDKIINDTYKAMEAQGLTIPIKLGHSKEQGVAKTLFGEDTKGLPALGWVKNIKKMGKKIVADLVDIPDKLYDMLGEKMWNNRSIELWEGFISNTGKNLGSVVTGLALLGAEQPAVTSLKALFEGEGKISTYSSKGEIMTEQVKATVVETKVETVVAKEENLTELQKNEKLREFKKQADEGAEAIKALAEFKKQTVIAEDKAFLKELADKGQLLPFQLEELSAVLPVMENKEVSFFDKEIEENVKGNAKDMFKKFLKSLPNQVQLAEFSKQSKTNRSEDIVTLVQDFMAKNPTVSREQAYKTVAKENNIQL